MSLFSEGSGMNRTIFQGDVLEKLTEIESESIDCIVSSPPYWGLRDYGVGGQLGLEPDFRDYLKIMNDIMVQLKRVLKNTGTCWINLGDTYGYNSGKSRYGIPERFYINCIDDGWIARNHIPWYKANSMPSSVKDRFTNKWESIFFFAKQQKYYFDLDSVREKTLTESKPFNVRVRDSPKGKYGTLFSATEDEIENHNSKGERKMLNVFYDKSKPYAVVEREGTVYFRNLPSHDKIREYLTKARKNMNITIKELEELIGVSAHHWFEDHTTPHSTYSFPTREDWIKVKDILNFDDTFDDQMTTLYPKNAEKINDPKGKNPGDVFFINPKPFPEAHFATFPVDLPTKILKCACPKDGIVLDPFLGSGTVGIAAEQLGLKWCGIELNEEYITLARKRLDPFRNDSLEMFT
jgi:DNA modification methylase